MAAVAPIKIDQATDELVTQAAHFLDSSKKDIVSQAVREYVEKHRDEINAGVQTALSRLNGTTRSGVALLTGMSDDEIDELGGLSN